MLILVQMDYSGGIHISTVKQIHHDSEIGTYNDKDEDVSLNDLPYSSDKQLA